MSPRDREGGEGEEGGEGVEGSLAELRALAPDLPARLEADPGAGGEDLGQLVLTLIEFLRQVLEHQAVRRLEAGSLSEEEEEQLGLALLRLRERVAELTCMFGLETDDLNVDLGPLGRLL